MFWLQKASFSMWGRGAPSRKKKNAQDQGATTWPVSHSLPQEFFSSKFWPSSEQVVTSCIGLCLLLPPQGHHGVEGPLLWVSFEIVLKDQSVYCSLQGARCTWWGGWGGLPERGGGHCCSFFPCLLNLAYSPKFSLKSTFWTPQGCCCSC